MQVASAVIAAVALTVSVLVFFDNRSRDQRAARLARRPALVFTWDGGQGVWLLSNLGNGPALDVVILQRVDDAWDHPLRVPELGVNQTEMVPRRWYEHWHTDPGLGARYRSIADEKYSTRTGDDRSQINDTWFAIVEGAQNRIEPHWKYRDGDQRGHAEGGPRP